MAKLKLAVSPTFKSKVAIPVPGSKPADVEFVFKAKTRDEFKEFIDSLKDREDEEVILEIASGWDLEDAFGADAVKQLVQNYLGAARAVISTYMHELAAARLGN